jgi:alcohol dehydrogenase class IV
MATLAEFPLRPFVAPSRVFAGPGAIAGTGGELAAAGIPSDVGPILVVADAILAELGLTDGVIESLSAAGYNATLAPEVTGEPTPETIEKLLAAVHGETVPAVVGIGGGSAIDASKLAAAALTNTVPLTEGLPPTATLERVAPIVAIPTTAGTGAEATAVAMLWHERRKRIFVHPRLVPRTAILDPDLLAGLPRPVAAASGLDAMSHAVESMLSTFRTPMTAEAARSAIRRLARALPVEFRATDPAARLDMSLGAYEAGLALNASVVVGHSLAYTIAAHTGLSHGVTCAMALPYCLAYCRSEVEPLLAEMGELVDIEGRPDAFVFWLVNLTHALQIPGSLADVGIERADLAGMAAECCASYPRPNNPVPVEPAPLERLLEQFHRGDIEGAWKSQLREAW